MDNTIALQLDKLLEILSVSETVFRENYFQNAIECIDNLCTAQKFTDIRLYRSDVFRIFLKIYKEQAKDKCCRDMPTQVTTFDDDKNIENISPNINWLINHYSQKLNNNASEKHYIKRICYLLYLLASEVSYDISLINTVVSNEFLELGGGQVAEIKAQTDDIGQNIKRIESEVKQQTEKIMNQQREYIAILSIFASVILAFIATFTFSNSVLNNIGTASLFRLLTVAIVIGGVSINLLFGLLFYVSKIINRDDRQFPLYVTNISFLILFFFIVLFQKMRWLE